MLRPIPSSSENRAVRALEASNTRLVVNAYGSALNFQETHLRQTTWDKVERYTNRHDKQCDQFGAIVEDRTENSGGEVHDCHQRRQHRDFTW